jgi:hypothetical protein
MIRRVLPESDHLSASVNENVKSAFGAICSGITNVAWGPEKDSIFAALLAD